jgi:DNA-directed RNA polymerase
MMELVRNTFIDIHFKDEIERLKADIIAKNYEKRGYTREVDDDEIIQLLRTTKKGI